MSLHSSSWTDGCQACPWIQSWVSQVEPLASVRFIYVETVFGVKVMSLDPQAEAEGPTAAVKVSVVWKVTKQTKNTPDVLGNILNSKVKTLDFLG